MSSRSSANWPQQGALAIFLAIIGYIAVNVAIIQTGSALINPALMNLLAGTAGVVIFRKEIKSRPVWWISLLGAVGIVGIVFGLLLTHQSLKDPSSAIEVIYDLLVISSVALWMLIEERLGLPETVFKKFDLVLHLCMAVLVVTRIAIHWKAGWSLQSFLPALLAVGGYWLFNVSIRVSQKYPKTTRPTNIAMNFFGGSILLVVALLTHNTAGVNSSVLIGAFGSVLIVFFLGKAYKILAPHGLSPLVVAGTYDGLLVLAPFAMLLIYGQKFLFADILITLGFVIVMATRVFLYSRE